MSARREPTFYAVGRADDHHASAPAVHPGQPIKSASHFTRFISGFQAISTLIGVPLALASGYTLYRTNFAPETGCSNLRSSIVSMLDKNVDPATRRMLVKRDVEAFERNCGGFDPDAQAAFRTLLATDKAVAQAAPAKAAPKPAVVARDVPKDEVRKAEPAKEPVKETAKEMAKAELRPAIVEKKSVAALAEPEAPAPVKPEAKPEGAVDAAPMSDSRWLDAVRSALGDHAGDAEAKAVPVKPKPQPVVASKPGEPVLQPGWTVSTPAAPPVAQAIAEPPVMQGAAAPLPPAVAVSEPQRTIPSDPNRPVPPAAIPAAQYTGANGGPNGGSWVAQIPFVGRIIEGSGN